MSDNNKGIAWGHYTVIISFVIMKAVLYYGMLTSWIGLAMAIDNPVDYVQTLGRYTMSYYH